jgi:hypothetical protein
MRLTIFTGVIGTILLLLVIELVRRRQLREKYAAPWILVAIIALPFAFFPRLPDNLAGMLGIVSGVSLVLFFGVVFLLLIAIYLSWELNQLEEETRSLAEEVALLREEIGHRNDDREKAEP